MSNNTNKTSAKGGLKILLAIWAVLELGWATLCGVLVSTGVNFLGSATHAGSTSVHIGGVAGFIAGFFVGAFQGVVFTGIAAIFVVVICVLIALFRGNGPSSK